MQLWLVNQLFELSLWTSSIDVWPAPVHERELALSLYSTFTCWLALTMEDVHVGLHRAELS